MAGIARATLVPNPLVKWKHWVADYALIRGQIAEALPEIFRDFNARLNSPAGFPRPLPAKDRQWKTTSGKANFLGFGELDADPQVKASGDDDVFRLMTLRSDDQFNTTIYSLDDRFRGIKGTRRVVLANRRDMERLELKDGDMVSLECTIDEGFPRQIHGFKIVAYDIPVGCLGGYYPECNPLIPLSHHAEQSKVPAAKGIPVRLIVQSGHL